MHGGGREGGVPRVRGGGGGEGRRQRVDQSWTLVETFITVLEVSNSSLTVLAMG
jgi:hypothetical protein